MPAKEDSQETDAEGEPKGTEQTGFDALMFRIISLLWIKLAKIVFCGSQVVGQSEPV